MAVLCLLALVLAPATHAQTITNIASASWLQSGHPVSISSNTLAFDVAPAPAALVTYTVAQDPTTTLTFAAPTCNGAAVPVTGTGGSGPAVVPVTESGSVQIGEVVYFRAYVPQANHDPTAIDSLTTTLVTTAGDKETITVYETGKDTGVFVGALPTTVIPPRPVQGDCRLSVSAGDVISILCIISGKLTPIATAEIAVRSDPFGFVFDSGDGSPVNGTSVSLVDAVTGAPVQVFAPDGVTSWPSTVTTGQSVQDGAGIGHQLLPGEYRFPLVNPGHYRLVIQPPSPYTAPSTATAQDLAGILRPDGTPVQVNDASYGRDFTVAGPEPVRIDVPLDRPATAVVLSKSASRAVAQPGDVVFYTLTVANPDATHARRDVVLVDKPANALHIRPQSLRVDGAPAPGAALFSSDGRTLTVNLGVMAPSATRRVTYAASVRPDAPEGQAPNTATATDSRGLIATARAVVRIVPDGLADRMTLVGRVTDGGCLRDAPHHGIPGVRVMLEDGSFAVTDRTGRYHFDGLVPGDHVAQVMGSTLPEGGRFVACGNSTRGAGSAISRFVSGRGGMLVVADFHAELPAPAPGATRNEDGPAPPKEPGKDRLSDRAAAGGETDWLALGDGPVDFLFPAVDHNPRSPVIRVVIRHRAGQTVALSANGKPVAAIAFDGSRLSPDRTYAVSIWRGVPLEVETTHLAAVVKNPDGSVAANLARDVSFTQTAAQVRLVPQLTHLVADASSRPVIALRITDRNGRPVHAGLSGELTLNAPYESAEAIDTMQARSLTNLGRSAPHWTVKGDDGIAYVELAPTMVSGALHLDFTFDDGDQKRHQSIDTWVVPGDLPWTLVGLAEGSVGARSIADVMERTGRFDSDLGKHARTAFYAKGRVLGRYLLTVAYDSAKQSADQKLFGALDPNAYYTVFADGSSRRFDAASRDKLYVRIESRAFYALFGDFQTGFAQTQLARYQRALTGVSAEATVGRVHVQGFGARTATTHRHIEIQGGGISGPYSLGSNVIVSNSETVTIQVRDRFRSQEIVSSTVLTRFLDYDIDLLSGTLTFKQPLLSHDASLNPQFVVVDYDVDPALGAANNLVGGARVDWTSGNGRLRIGATGISDHSDTARTNLGAVDARLALGRNTEVRAEGAVSRSLGVDSLAWLVEAEHHDRRLDVMAYARSVDGGFGLGETGNAEIGWRKIGVDAKMRVTDAFSVVTSAWIDDSLTNATTRKALQLKGEYRTRKGDYHVGISTIDDRVAGGTGLAAPVAAGSSTVVEAGATRRLFNDRLQIEAATSFSLGSAQSLDLPATTAVTARFSLNSRVKLVASHEVAKGSALHTHTTRAGFELQPWRGGKVTAVAGNQTIDEYGARSFATLGLAQSYDIGKNLTIDGTVDANKVLSGFDASRIVNGAHPVVNGGQLNGSGTLTENFTAVTLGAGWRRGLWAVTMRGEYRAGEFADRRGLTFGAIRQLGDGSVIGSGLTVTHASGDDGSMSSVIDGSIAFAERPANANFAILGKLEFRSDVAQAATTSGSAGSIAGLAGTADQTALTTSGYAKARRIIASFSADWTPHGKDGNAFTERSEFSLFLGARHNFDIYDGYNLAGTTLLAGFDAHFGLSEKVDIGGTFTLRTNLADHTTSLSVGPAVNFVPAKDVVLTFGYNISGFRDSDFGANRATNRGVFASLRMKFDTSTFGFLGLDGHRR